jgi:zinc transport system substrate-binding protein
MKSLLCSLVLAVAFGAGMGCSPAPSDLNAASAKRLKVVTSFLPVYCFTANVAGDLAEVENLLPAGVGPHDYNFSPRDLRKLASADVIVVNGLGLEDWLERAIRSAKGRPPLIVEAAAGLKKELIEECQTISVPPSEGQKSSAKHHEHDHGHGPNPHIWLDPHLAIHAVKNIQAALQKLDPENAASYAQNAEAYIARLQALDRDLAQTLEPVRDAAFITFHNAFPYFVQRYQLYLVGVVEEIPDVNPSPRQLKNLMQVIRDKNARVIFTEPQFSARLAREIARDLGVKLAELDTLETGPLRPGTYEEGMRRNAAVILQTLK